jgi:SagB-type dehydrogenase family enzyme
LSDKKKPPLKWKKPVYGIFSGGGEQEKLETALLELKDTIATIQKQVNRLRHAGTNQGKGIPMTDLIQRYHRQTQYDPMKMGGHALDWSNQPGVYKNYSGLGRVNLPEISALPDKSFSELMMPCHTAPAARVVSIQDISRILFLGYGITARRQSSGDDFYYRSVPSAGALYPCELYLATQSVSALENGLYHHAIHRRDLSRLRAGVYKDPSAAGEPRKTFSASVTFYITAIFYRSIWKYRDRAYRYHLLDTGHLVESLVLAIKSMDLPCHVTYDFDDSAMNAFLGVDSGREGCLAVVSIPGGASTDERRELPVEGLSHAAASRVSPREEMPAAIREIHEASSRVVGVKERRCDMLSECGVRPQQWQSIHFEAHFPEKMNYSQAVMARRSRRNFIPRPLGRQEFQALMQTIWMPDDGDFQPFHFVALGMIVGACEGLDSGQYWIDPHAHAIGQVRPGEFSADMSRIALNQQWMESAGLQFFFVAPFSVIETLWGPRAYRYAMISAGRLAHRLYLGATALGLGCCGIGAFYDRDASTLLGLNPLSALLYMVAAGPIKHQLK